MKIQIGDKVIHWAHGLGEVIKLEEKSISGQKMTYFVVQVKDMTIWVPADGADTGSLRLPTPAGEFGRLFAVLGGPSKPLSNDRLERKSQLINMVKEGTSEAICRVVRDLSFYRRTKKLNENESSILKHALTSLLNEWQFALSVPQDQAENELQLLLEGRPAGARLPSG